MGAFLGVARLKTGLSAPIFCAPAGAASLAKVFPLNPLRGIAYGVATLVSVSLFLAPPTIMAQSSAPQPSPTSPASPAVPAYTQSQIPSPIADEIDKILGEDSINWEQAARFVLPATGRLPANTNEAGAYTFAEVRMKLPKNVKADTQITLAGLCYLVMNSFEMKGGLMYRFSQSPRYAYRELVKRGIVQGRRDPMQKVSGSELLQIISRTAQSAGSK
jgi:hypothetical protein